MNLAFIEETLQEYFPQEQTHEFTEGSFADISWIEAPSPKLLAKTGLRHYLYGGMTATKCSAWELPNIEIGILKTEAKQESIEVKFRRYLDAFKKETLLYSSIDKKISNINYLMIVGLGKEVIPLILSEYLTNGGFWHNALVALTGANPVTVEMHGKPKIIREAWKTWAIDYGCF